MPTMTSLAPKTCPFCKQAFVPRSSVQTICENADCRKARDNARSRGWHARQKQAAQKQAAATQKQAAATAQVAPQ